VYSLWDNPVGVAGSRAVAAAIADNEDTALISLNGIDLCDFLDVLGLPNELRDQSNEDILEYIRQRRIATKVKSARGGIR
jgi:hypothetical protein